jgi:hypothetical protein
MPKKTSKKSASDASSILKKDTTSSKAKSAAGSALSQRKVSSQATSPKAAKKASAVLRDGRTSSKTKTAASALTQLKNPRSGRFIKINKATGTIIAHKKSEGAYKDVPITETSYKRK